MALQFFLGVNSCSRRCRVLICPMPLDELRRCAGLDEYDFSHRCVTRGVSAGIDTTLNILRRDYTGRKFSPGKPIKFSCGEGRFFVNEIWEVD